MLMIKKEFGQNMKKNGYVYYIRQIDSTHFALLSDVMNEGFNQVYRKYKPAIYHVDQLRGNSEYKSIINFLHDKEMIAGKSFIENTGDNRMKQIKEFGKDDFYLYVDRSGKMPTLSHKPKNMLSHPYFVRYVNNKPIAFCGPKNILFTNNKVWDYSKDEYIPINFLKDLGYNEFEESIKESFDEDILLDDWETFYAKTRSPAVAWGMLQNKYKLKGQKKVKIFKLIQSVFHLDASELEESTKRVQETKVYTGDKLVDEAIEYFEDMVVNDDYDYEDAWEEIENEFEFTPKQENKMSKYIWKKYRIDIMNLMDKYK